MPGGGIVLTGALTVLVESMKQFTESCNSIHCSMALLKFGGESLPSGGMACCMIAWFAFSTFVR